MEYHFHFVLNTAGVHAVIILLPTAWPVEDYIVYRVLAASLSYLGIYEESCHLQSYIPIQQLSELSAV